MSGSAPRRVLTAGALAVLLSVSTANGETVTFFVEDPEGRNVVTFASRAPLETIHGTTNRITGKIVVDPENVLDANAQFTVDLASLKTGIALRDEQMRDQYLETKAYPVVRLKLDRVTVCEPAALVPGLPCSLRAVGILDLHGHLGRIPVTAKVVYHPENETTRVKMPGNLLRVEASFSLKLGDFDIPVPSLVALKLDETIRVTVDVTATDANPRDRGAP